MSRNTEASKLRSKLAIRVTPNAKRNEITDFLEDGTIKIRLKAPPVDGKANKELIMFLAKLFGIRKSSIKIISGLTSRNKTVLIEGIEPKSARAIMMAHRQ